VDLTPGAEFFTRRLAETFDYLEGADVEPAEPEERGVHIGFSMDSDRPSGMVPLSAGASSLPLKTPRPMGPTRA
jgi:hypothetical protein